MVMVIRPYSVRITMANIPLEKLEANPVKLIAYVKDDKDYNVKP